MKKTCRSIPFFLFLQLLHVVAINAFAQRATPRDYVFSRAPLLKGSYAELPLGSIKAKGWLLKQLELQASGFTGHAEDLYPEPDNLGPSSDWLGGTGKGWERVPYYVKGLVALAYTLDDPDLKKKAEKWINWTLESQQANGVFGPPSMDDWWPRMPMMYAIKSFYEATGDQRVVPFFSKYFRYQLANLSRKPLTEWSKSRTGDNIEIVLWLYNKTGDKELLTLANMLEKQAYPWKDIFTNNLFYHFGDDFHTKHSVSVGQALKFPAVCYQKSGDIGYREAFRKGIEHLMRDHGQASGIASGTEFLAGRSSIQGVETCTVVEWMQSLETAARIIDDPAIGDRLEKIAFNALPAQFSRDLKEHLYYAQPNQVRCKQGLNGFDEDYAEGLLLSPYSGMGCCRYNLHMGWPYFVKNSWVATPDKGLAVIAYAPVEVQAIVGNNSRIKITEETNYPFEEQIKLTVSLDKSTSFPLRLRIPAWCKNPVVSINGKKQSKIESGSIALIERQWNDKDEVTLFFPMEITSKPQVNNAVSIERGPLVFALQMEAKYVSVKEHRVKGFHDYEVFPVGDWNYGLILDKKNLNELFKVEKSSMPENPFIQETSPVKLRAKARKIKEWTMAYNGILAFDVPHSPVASVEPVEEITLAPFGSENLRISTFPVIGSAAKRGASFSDNFEDNVLDGWVWYGGGWYTREGAIHAASNKGSWGYGIHGSKVLAPSVDVSDFALHADIATGSIGNAGVVFRVTNPSIGADFYQGYYVGLNPQANRIEIGKADNQKYVLLASSSLNVDPERMYKLRVEAIGSKMRVFLDNSEAPVLSVEDDQYKKGMIGLRSYDAFPVYDNVRVETGG